MGVLKFELKKIIAQKKFLWMLIVILLITAANLWLNIYHKDDVGERALDEIRPLMGEWVVRESELIELRDEYGLDEMQEGQLENTREMIRALERWRLAIAQERWDIEIVTRQVNSAFEIHFIPA